MNHMPHGRKNFLTLFSRSDPSLAGLVCQQTKSSREGAKENFQETKKSPFTTYKHIEGISRSQEHAALNESVTNRQNLETHRDREIKDSQSRNLPCRPYRNTKQAAVPQYSDHNVYPECTNDYPRSPNVDANPSHSTHGPAMHRSPYYPTCAADKRDSPSFNYSSNPLPNVEYHPGNVSKYSAYPPYFNKDVTYPFPFPYSPGYPDQKSQNDETVKNLLQLVNSQNEQIKTLQIQVDRLLKIQETAWRKCGKCTCTMESPRQNAQVHMRSYDVVNTASTATTSHPQNQSMETNLIKSMSKTGDPGTNSNAGRYGNDWSEMNAPLQEDKSRSAILEQVSIGVMTSFEFTVQNNQPALEPEDRVRHHRQAECERLYRNNGINSQEPDELPRKSQNTFSRMPRAPLENIIEDSESHLSSQQPSSNFYTNPSVKETPEKTDYLDSDQPNTVGSQEAEFRGHGKRSDHAILMSEMDRLQYFKKQSENYIDTLREASQRQVPFSGLSPPDVRSLDDTRNYKATQNDATFRGKLTGLRAPDDVDSRSRKPIECPRKNPNARKNSPTGTKAITGDTRERNGNKDADESLVLSGGELEVKERPPPSPEPSIHVEMQEYSSDEDSEHTKRTPKIGWTFYNDVLGQVNQILQNSPIEVRHGKGEGKNLEHNKSEKDDTERKALLDTVKAATMEQLKKLGISFSENPEASDVNGTKRVTFDSSYYPRLDYRASVPQGTSAIAESNSSMHMKALELKYLSDEQLAEIAMQKQGAGTLKHLTLSNVQGTNMSFATMRYLERYQLLPGKMNAQNEGGNHDIAEIPLNQKMRNNNNAIQQPVAKGYPPLIQTPRTSCPSKILDISTLKQQPKLL
ncbi:uncharacterized protein LOC105701664 isoform X2 [Orussus abietinus]|uniref:uncharacterized protein LOC105701664 isoform X2 n=1 Tax=Orussus abietinus TaxID=222816 RepID=UPI0006258841|nr:uncharacterized protein LOC105701664 isoform X2 [Orussus abietinus]